MHKILMSLILLSGLNVFAATELCKIKVGDLENFFFFDSQKNLRAVCQKKEKVSVSDNTTICANDFYLLYHTQLTDQRINHYSYSSANTTVDFIRKDVNSSITIEINNDYLINVFKGNNKVLLKKGVYKLSCEIQQ